MNRRITVIPSDQLISVDGEILTFSYNASEGMHALQWNGTFGHIEWNGKSNQVLDESDYAGLVQPYLDLWIAEKERLEAEAQKPLFLDDAKTLARERLRAVRKSVEYGGFSFNGQWWASEEKDELRLNSVSKLFDMGLPEYQGWKIAEGKYITLTPGLLKEASLALMNHYSHCFSLEERKLVEIDSLATSEAVLAWLDAELETGWENNA